MHELAIAGDIVQETLRISAENQLKRVTSITVVLGAATCLQADSLRFGVQALATDTLAEGAEIVIRSSPVEAYCRFCQWRGPLQTAAEPSCPQCGMSPIRFESGRELILHSIEGEQ